MKKLFSDDNYNYGSAMKTAIVAFTLNPALFGSETQVSTGEIKKWRTGNTAFMSRSLF